MGTPSPSSITFAATSNRNLVPYELPPDRRDGVADIDTLLRQSRAFHGHYGPTLESGVDGEEPWDQMGQTVTKPDVFLVRGSSWDENEAQATTATVPTVAPTANGLVGIIATAYNWHQNLVLRPDDVWVTIMSQFSAYVNARGETLRSKFVAHEGQKNLKVTAVGSVFSAPFADMTRTFLDLISENIKDASLREWFLPGFTTSSPTDDVCASAAAMCTLSSYFTYTFSLVCGIPRVTLLGTVEDWTSLRAKVDRLLEFDTPEEELMSEWVPKLRYIADNFVESAQNGSANNLDFWDTVLSHKGGGSGPTYLTGWVTAFSFFDEDGQPTMKRGVHFYEYDGAEYKEKVYDRHNSVWNLIETDRLNHNVISCPVDIDDNGTPYKGRLFVGQMGFEVETDANEDVPVAIDSASLASTESGRMMVLRPRNDWALAIEKGEKVMELTGDGGGGDEFGLHSRDQCPLVGSDDGMSPGGGPVIPDFGGIPDSGGLSEPQPGAEPSKSKSAAVSASNGGGEGLQGWAIALIAIAAFVAAACLVVLARSVWQKRKAGRISEQQKGSSDDAGLEENDETSGEGPMESEDTPVA